MLKFYADKFVRLSATLVYIEGVVRQHKVQPEGLQDFEYVGMRTYVQTEVLPLLESIGLRLSVKKAKKIANDQLPITFLEDVSELHERIKDELEDENFFHLTPTETGFFEPQEPLFGASFQVQFPNAIYDLDEAGKCLGLGRSTAAVFHLMRIVEAGLRAVYLCLGITAVLKGRNRNWARIFERIDKAIEANSKAASGGWGARRDFQELRAHIASLGDAWRNPTMHVGSKRTPEEAEAIFRAVRSLMQKISSRMDENGLPLA